MASKDRILFLDIDGVLNDHGTAHFFHYLYENNQKDLIRDGLVEDFSISSLGNLIRIVTQTKCKIVVSSTWRLGSDLEEMKGWFKNFPVIQDAIIGKTDSIDVRSKIEKNGHKQIHNVPRGLECKVWLSDHDYCTYWDDHCFAVVDDDSDMWPIEKCFFQTNNQDGLTSTVANKIINHLMTKSKRESKDGDISK